MFYRMLPLLFIVTLSSCAQTDRNTASPAKSDGEVVSSTGPQTFHARYNGKGPLQLGEKFNIVEYQPYSEDLRNRESRNLPFMADEQSKKIIGQATVSNILNNNIYEFKTDRPQHVPENALIEKL